MMAANIVVRISLRLYNHHQISSAIMVGGGDEIPTASRLWLIRYDALKSTPKANELPAVIGKNNFRTCKSYLARSTNIQRNRTFEKSDDLNMYTKYILCLLLRAQQTVEFSRDHKS
jgi:hypothetical protein